jgi:hypothetical protein
MGKFIKVALLKQKERFEQQELQLEEVRTGESYTSLSEGLEKSHKVIEEHIELQLAKKHSDPYDVAFEELLDKAGLYSRKNNKDDKPLAFMVDSNNKGIDERFIEEQLNIKRTE